ncbi:RNA-directed DNA polymerase (reverse transcriptase)-related family protein [Rhynchospora pubera]|uniref:RNA-directed DNA polymerase (Reverse transcriptase)-related family protein n=1 Tax=Rhynchospora pubera TaxID=906938 RepID=A0AAV8DAR6_9POAL|nr:RNA-directed DNA polymerase (reverse transcriptase)-related family protein [Rhynchospora pubera]
MACPFFLLQYADDTLVFCTADSHTLGVLHLTLQLFSRISGLEVNLQKSSFIPYNVSEEVCSFVSQLFRYPRTELPLLYLGLPLTVSRPSRSGFQPLLEKIDKKLAGWKAKLLSRAGRLTRGGGQRISLLAWDRVCLPRVHGGLGLIDFSLHNKALLLRRLWKLYTDRSSLWFKVTNILLATQRGCKSPSLWITEGSFFWRDLRSLFPLFQLSTRIQVQASTDTSFWYDNWDGKPLLFLTKSEARPPRPRICLKEGLARIVEITPLPHTLNSHDIISNAPLAFHPVGSDLAQWVWTTDRIFSVASTYKALSSAGKLKSPFMWIWKLHVPPSLKLFLFLLSCDRVLTRQQLSKRGLHTQSGCDFCSSTDLEDNLHLFFTCPFSASVRRRLQIMFQTPCLLSSVSTRQALLSLFLTNNLSRLQSTVLATSLYAIWLERNNRVFRDSSRSVQNLVDWIIVEANDFLRVL